jgi:hypothetical protein
VSFLWVFFRSTFVDLMVPCLFGACSTRGRRMRTEEAQASGTLLLMQVRIISRLMGTVINHM